jgi:hypothetical protein
MHALEKNFSAPTSLFPTKIDFDIRCRLSKCTGQVRVVLYAKARLSWSVSSLNRPRKPSLPPSAWCENDPRHLPLSLRQLAQEVNHSGWIGIAMDQLLGPDTGRLFNDEAAAVAAKSESPEKAAKTIKDSLAKNHM